MDYESNENDWAFIVICVSFLQVGCGAISSSPVHADRTQPDQPHHCMHFLYQACFRSTYQLEVLKDFMEHV